MPVRPILKLGHPVLREVAVPVEDPAAAEVAALLQDMRDTLDAVRGNGIAAPQIGVARRVVLIAIPRHRLPECDAFPPVPWQALVNPVVEPVTEERRAIGLERCLSIPGLTGAVPRATAIRVRAATPDGAGLDFVARGYHARLIQHEVDHLDGILFPMRMTDLGTLAFTDQMPPEAFDLAPEDCPDPTVGGLP